MNADNAALELFYVLPPIANHCQVNMSLNHRWIKSGVRLSNLSSFCEVVRSILLQCKGKASIRMSRPKRMAVPASKSQHRNCATHTLGKVESAKTPGFKLRIGAGLMFSVCPVFYLIRRVGSALGHRVNTPDVQWKPGINPRR